MRSTIARVTIKIIELLGCIACFITKVITDLEARRVFLRNQKYSRCIDANSRPSVIEKIFLVVGMLSFFTMGGLVLAAFDQVPWELHDNSIILGCLSFFVALVMMYDLADPLARLVSDTTQTDTNYNMHHQQHQQTQQPPTEQQNPTHTTENTTTTTSTTTIATETNASHPVVEPPKPVIEKVEPRSKSYQSTSVAPTIPNDIAKNGNYHRGDSIDFIQLQHMPKPEQPVFERVLLPEKKRPTFNKVADPQSAIVHNVQPEEYVVHEMPNLHQHDHIDSTIQYNQVPKYAAIQRQQTVPTHQYLDHSPYAQKSPMYKLNRGFEHGEYERAPRQTNIDYERPPKHTIIDYERPPRHANIGYEHPPKHTNIDYERQPKHTNIDCEHLPQKQIISNYGRSPPKIRTIRSDEMNRYHDAAPEHYQNQPPMMVIRNYQPISVSTRPSTAAQQQSMAERRQNQSNDNNYHRTGNNGIKKHGAHQNSRKNGCCDSDEVDFRKMNSAIRPGFVATVAKMWDRRAVENSGEFNTIV